MLSSPRKGQQALSLRLVHAIQRDMDRSIRHQNCDVVFLLGFVCFLDIVFKVQFESEG